ncbi:hypothetical protein DSL72_001680 [Monilinia vaccinii-corymbosi]|uniref:Uncharacterized protein n=1 Tax=Monilinia vaccinii-corymbosi TaxID=61207 RepID=A0A8A3P818_9HELO|nr:hypothetical protein DSL72_001680 [Monilinia vaccinii-corymbosi]
MKIPSQMAKKNNRRRRHTSPNYLQVPPLPPSSPAPRSTRIHTQEQAALTANTTRQTEQLLQSLDRIAGPGAEDEKKRRVMAYTQKEKNIKQEARNQARNREKRAEEARNRERRERIRREKDGEGEGEGVEMGGGQTRAPTREENQVIEKNKGRHSKEAGIEMIGATGANEEVEEVRSAEFQLPGVS